MDQEEIIFRGPAQVYLEGRNALLPVDQNSNGNMEYFVGSPGSTIRVKDYRSEPTKAAKLTLMGRNGFEFADTFNQPAWVEIRVDPNGVLINLHEYREEEGPILWLGVFEEELMPVHQIEWEVLKPIGPSQIAFAALVR